MVGTSRPGAINVDGMAGTDTKFSMPGMTRGTAPFLSTWHATDLAHVVLTPDADTGSGEHTAVSKTGATAATSVKRDGVSPDGVLVGTDFWFERLHIFRYDTTAGNVVWPAAVDFGNILTLEVDNYEIYNAFRTTTIGINDIDDSAVQPGIDLDEMVVTFNIDPQTSALDSSTTDNSTGLGLGNIVQLQVFAEADGLPIFDAPVVFTDTVNSESVSLNLSGSRIVLLPFEYEAPCQETLAFLTDIITALDGKEQRIALRKNPRQMFQVTYLLDANDRQRMQGLLMDWMDNVFGFPLQHEVVYLSTAVSAAATSYSTTGADLVDFRVGGLGAIFTDNETFDVLNIATVSATTITASDPSVNAYPAGTKIWPVRTARILKAVSGRRYANNLEEFRVTFEVTENDIGALAGSSAAYSTYNSRTLFDDCNVIDSPGGAMPTRYMRRLHRIDNQTGLVHVSSTWDRGKRAASKGFLLRDRQEILDFRKAMLDHRGRQKAFYLPTEIEDVTVAATLTTGVDTMDIEHIDYVRFIQSREPKIIMKITYDTGGGETTLVRVVDSAIEVSDTVERLDFNGVNWPETILASEVIRVQFYELHRSDTDNINIVYPRIGMAECDMPTMQVFDDN